MPAFFAMPGNTDLAEALAVQTGMDAGLIETHRFPDGESYIRVHGPADERAFLVCSLVRPDEQFLPLIFAARAMRGAGAKQITLVAPYLSYLRQDRQFKEGEAVSSRVFADLVSREFDAMITIDPHLHRYSSLNEIYRIPATQVQMAGVIGAWVRQNVEAPVVIGPDEESAQWVRDVAREAGCPYAVFQKERHGDRDVAITPPSLVDVRNHTPVVVDDMISSGGTVLGTANILRSAGLRPGICIAVHALFDDSVAADLTSAFTDVVTSDSVPNRFSRFAVAPAIASQIG